MNSLFKSFDDLFYNFPTEGKPPVSKYYEYVDGVASKVCLQFALAGMDESEVSVSYDNRKLYIEGDNMGRDGICDKFRNKFSREYIVSDMVDLVNTKSRLENGLLTIELPLVSPKKSRKYLMGAPE